MIDSKEDSVVVTADIPVSFLHTDDTIDITHLKFYGMMEELLACIDPYLYRKYTTTDEKGLKIMYS